MNSSPPSSTNVLADLVDQFLLGPRVRQNHALEHATIHLLSAHHPRVVFRGRATSHGFYIYFPNATPVTREQILSCAAEALDRLRGDQPGLAIHPRCGTMLAVAGLTTGIAATAASDIAGRRDSTPNRYGWAVLAALTASFWAHPLGLLTQKYVTTLTPRPTLEIIDLYSGHGLLGAHAFVQTRHH